MSVKMTAFNNHRTQNMTRVYSKDSQKVVFLVYIIHTVLT